MPAPEYIILAGLLIASAWLGIRIINHSEKPRDLTADELTHGDWPHVPSIDFPQHDGSK